MQAHVQPMRYHGPGWMAEPNGWLFQVWAPNEKRDHWSASYQSPTDPYDEDDCGEGDFRRGESLDAVLAIFPEGVARAFRKAIECRP